MTTSAVNSTLINLPPGSLETTNTKLAAALSAVGIPLREECPVRHITGVRGGDSYCFFFQEKSPCGDYITAELIRAWDDPVWHMKHPEHPFAYLKVGFDNAERLTDMIRSGTPIGCVTKGSKIGFLTLDASDAAQKIFFQELKRPR
ncbi:MAG: hypothetical protein V4819_19180 [Verrucomicrobiota bacterium]